MANECRPKHSRKFAQFSEEWYAACDKAFVKAMKSALASPRKPITAEVARIISVYYGACIST